MIDSSLCRVKQLFAAAVQLPPAEVRSFLDSSCTEDPATRAEIESLLDAHANAGHFLDPSGPGVTPPAAMLEGTDDHCRWLLLGERPGSVIDRYKLLELIGEGGFGIVFRAEQTHPVSREVALKVIKLGMDTAQVVARFEAERQALAIMDHPNIARVIDAGATPGGRPYFVMELVDGVPVTQFCDDRRLGIRDRLELFVRICQAVQHAHQKGIIHRDLKPTNILIADVEGIATPKIIDFGIAKAISAALIGNPLFTDNRQLIGTPQYMSPEQADTDGRGADTQSDVYSLGVLLYELLTGSTPLDASLLRDAPIEQTRRLLRSHEAQKPSTRILAKTVPIQRGNEVTTAGRFQMQPSALARLLRRELDWIVMKAIEKDRPRRYQTASALAEDVQRYLVAAPVLARPASRIYHLRKFVSRHRVTLALVAIILVCLITGLAAASIGLLHARAAQREAVQRLFDSRLSQARAGRFSGRPGQRIEGLQVLSEAARVRPDLSVRNEAIACLALPDIEPIRRWYGRPEQTEELAFDAAFTCYARSDSHGNIEIHSAADDHVMKSLAGHGLPVARVFMFSPDGRYLVATYTARSCELLVWDVKTTKLAFRTEVPLSQEHAIQFSHDGRLLAFPLSSNTIAIQDVASRRQLDTLPIEAPIERIRFHPTEPRLAVSSPRWGIRVLDLHSHAVVLAIAEPQSIIGLAYSEDGAMIAAATSDRRIFVWNARTAALHSILAGQLSHAVSIEFSHGGELLLSTAYDGTLRLWNPFSGREMIATDDLPYLQVASNGRHLATTGGSYARQWELTVSRECRTLGGPIEDEQNGSIDISPGGSLMAAAGTFGVRVWELPSGRPASWLDSPGARSVVFTPDGKQLLVSCPAGVRRWSLPFGPLPDTENHGNYVKWGSRTAAAMSADGRTLVFSTPDGRLWVSDPSDPQSRILLGRQSETPRIVAVSPDGRWAASSRRADSAFKVWDVRQHCQAVELPSSIDVAERGNVVFSPDGRWLVTSDPDAYSFWEVGAWKLHHRLSRALPSYFGGYAAFSRDGKTIAVIGANRDITLVDPESGTELATLANPEPHEIQCFSFSSDGRYLAVGNNDPTVTLWDLALIRRELGDMGLDWTTPGR